MPPSAGKKKRGKPKQKSRPVQQSPNNKSNATDVELTDSYTAADAERYLRVKAALAVHAKASKNGQLALPHGNGQSLQHKRVHAILRCGDRRCKTDAKARLCCLPCARVEQNLAGRTSCVRGPELTGANGDAALPPSTLVEVSVPVSAVVAEVCLRTAHGAQEVASADKESVQLTALIEMGVTQDPIVTVVYEAMPATQQTMLATVAPRYPSLLPSTEEVLNYAAFIEHLESDIKFKSPGVFMPAEHFPYVAKCKSIQDYIGVLTQVGEDALHWKQAEISDKPSELVPHLRTSADKKNIICAIQVPQAEELSEFAKESETPQDKSTPHLPMSADASIACVFHPPARQPSADAAHATESATEDTGARLCPVGVLHKRAVREVHSKFKTACMRLQFFRHASDVAKRLEQDIRSLVGNGVHSDGDRLRMLVDQLERAKYVCDYVNQALQQQLKDLCEKIAGSEKIREQIDSILAKKGSARMELERKIIRAGKRASESAVQRAHERNVADIEEEQPLRDQKLQTENELRLRSEYRSVLAVEIAELTQLSQEFDVIEPALRKLLVSGGSGTSGSSLSVSRYFRMGATSPVNGSSQDSQTVETSRKLVQTVLEVISTKRRSWEARQMEWYEHQQLLGRALRDIAPHYDGIRDAVYAAVRQKLTDELQTVVASERNKQREEREAALRRSQQTEQELLRLEAERQKREDAKQAKLRARELKRQQAEQARLAEIQRRAVEARQQAEAAQASREAALAEQRKLEQQHEHERLARLQAEIEFGYATENVLDVDAPASGDAFTTIKQKQQPQQDKGRSQTHLKSKVAAPGAAHTQMPARHHPPLAQKAPSAGGKAQRGTPTTNGVPSNRKQASQPVPSARDPNAFPVPNHAVADARTSASVSSFLKTVERTPAPWSPARLPAKTRASDDVADVEASPSISTIGATTSAVTTGQQVLPTPCVSNALDTDTEFADAPTAPTSSEAPPKVMLPTAVAEVVCVAADSVEVLFGTWSDTDACSRVDASPTDNPSRGPPSPEVPSEALATAGVVPDTTPDTVVSVGEIHALHSQSESNTADTHTLVGKSIDDVPDKHHGETNEDADTASNGSQGSVEDLQPLEDKTSPMRPMPMYPHNGAEMMDGEHPGGGPPPDSYEAMQQQHHLAQQQQMVQQQMGMYMNPYRYPGHFMPPTSFPAPYGTLGPADMGSFNGGMYMGPNDVSMHDGGDFSAAHPPFQPPPPIDVDSEAGYGGPMLNGQDMPRPGVHSKRTRHEGDGRQAPHRPHANNGNRTEGGISGRGRGKKSKRQGRGRGHHNHHGNNNNINNNDNNNNFQHYFEPHDPPYNTGMDGGAEGFQGISPGGFFHPAQFAAMQENYYYQQQQMMSQYYGGAGPYFGVPNGAIDGNSIDGGADNGIDFGLIEMPNGTVHETPGEEQEQQDVKDEGDQTIDTATMGSNETVSPLA
eukprot:m.1003157 g.1003157  ORF g.1003157 m.1003157 type:complete len:1445 (+) comp24041_c0_seq3:377-4711(+)